MLSSGALVIRFPFLAVIRLVRRSRATERGLTEVRVPSTLLGPEEAAASLRASDSYGQAERCPGWDA
jgi:hypothetical protein